MSEIEIYSADRILAHSRGFQWPSRLDRLQQWQAAVAQRESVRSIANAPEFYLERYGRLAQTMFN